MRFVRRLNASGYFASAQAAIDPEPRRTPDDATVKVAVIEAPPKRLEGGVGYSTDVQFRGNATYRDVNIDGKGLQMLIEGRLESSSSSRRRYASRSRRTTAGWIGTYSAGAERTDIEGLSRARRTSARAGTRSRSATNARCRRRTTSTSSSPSAPGSGRARTRSISTAERYWRRTDDLIAPTTGWMARSQVGGGVPGVSTRGFGRVIGRFAAWLPIDAEGRARVSRAGRRGARVDARRHSVGAALPHGRRHDGARLRVREPRRAATATRRVPGRYYAVFNVEVTHWIGESWGIAAFVDAGNAIDTPGGHPSRARLRHRLARALAARTVPRRRRVWSGRAPIPRWPFGGAQFLMVETTPESPRPQPRRRPPCRPRSRARARGDVRVAGGCHLWRSSRHSRPRPASPGSRASSSLAAAARWRSTARPARWWTRCARSASPGAAATHGRRDRRRADVAALGAVLARDRACTRWAPGRSTSNSALPTRPIAAPSTLALPLDVAIERVAVGTLTWRVGANGGKIEGLEFGYTGNGTEHRVSDLRLVTMAGTISGDATLGARRAVPAGRAHSSSSATRRCARRGSTSSASGTLSSLAVDATVTRRRRATRPRMPRWRRSRSCRSSRSPSRPATSISPRGTVRCRRRGSRRTVEREAREWRPRGHRSTSGTRVTGTLDTGRTPMRALAAQFAWTRDAITFDAISAEIAGGGRATGRSRIALGTTASGGTWHLDVRDVDLRQLFPGLVATRLGGTIDANLDAARRTLSGTLVDRRIAGGISRRVRGDVRRSDRRDPTASRSRGAGRGSRAAAASTSTDSARSASTRTATKLDPSRFGAYPAGAIDAEVKATGTLTPTWRVDGSSRSDTAASSQGSHSGEPPAAVSSRTRARCRDRARQVGRATLVANGSLGAAGDRMTFALDAPELAELVPLLAEAACRARSPASCISTATMTGAPPAGGLDVTVRGARSSLAAGSRSRRSTPTRRSHRRPQPDSSISQRARSRSTSPRPTSARPRATSSAAAPRSSARSPRTR